MTPGGSLRALAWAPDGSALVFAGTTHGKQQLFIRPLEGAEARPFSGPEGESLTSLALMRDGRGAIAAAAEGRFHVWLLP